MKKLEVVIYYNSDDLDFGGDYEGVKIFIDGKSVIRYGSHYDEKGRERADGFIDGIKYLCELNGIKVPEITYREDLDEL